MTSAIQMEMDLFKQSTVDRFMVPGSDVGSVADQEPSTSEVISAWWTNETVLGDAYSYLTERSGYSGEVGDPNFNPYIYFEENKDKFGDLEEFILDGTFGRVEGPRQFEAVANSLRRELANRQIIEQSSGVDFALGLGASLLDPSTFIPIIGWGSRAGRVGYKALSTGAQVGTVVAGEELLHHSVQRARTTYESIMAVGGATVLGAGIGGLSGYLSTRAADNLMSIDNPRNPLKDENVTPHEPGTDVIVADTSQGVSQQVAEATGAKISFDPENGVQLDVQTLEKVLPELEEATEAASAIPPVARGTPRFTPGEEVTPTTTGFSRAIDWTQGKLGITRSPTTVATYTASNTARNVLTSMAEMGIRTTQMAAGKARDVSAELWKDLSVYAKQMSSEQRMVAAWEKLRKEQGAKSAIANKYRSDIKEAAQFAGIKTDNNFISLADFAYLVQRKMRGGDISTNTRNIPIDKSVIRAVDEAIDGYSQFLKDMFTRAVATKLLRADQYIDSYLPQIWNREAIIADPERLVQAFKRKFASRYEGDARGEAGLDEFARELVNKLSKGQHPGFQKDGFIRADSFQLGKSKRTETRELLIKGEELDDFEDFLVQDITRLTKQYADDMGGRIVLTEFFGKYTAKGDKDPFAAFEELGNPMEEIAAEFDALRKANPADRAKLDRDEELVGQAVRNLRERLLNIDRRSDHGDGVMFLGRTARRVNFLRFMGSVVLASLTDLATISFSHGASKHIGKMVKNFGNIAKEAKGMNNRELAFMLYGAEGTMGHARMAKLVGLDDDLNRRGFGVGRTRKISAGADAGMDWMSNQMNYLNLMHWWNSRHKFITGHIVLGNMLDDAARLNRGEKLANRGRRSGNYKWNELGISDAQLKRMDELVQKHGYDTEIEGVQFRWPDLDKWLDEADGLELSTALQAALKRSTDRAVITPGIADLPMYHSTQIGQLLFQFNSFGFAAVNKYVRNLADEAVHGDAMSSLISTTWALGMGVTAYYVRQGLIRGQELPDPDKEPATWIYEGIDRSGLMMWMMPFSNSAMKLMAPHLNDLGIGITQPSRFAQQRWWESLAGPSVSTASDVANMVFNLSQGDLEKVTNKAYRLTPYRNLFWLEALWRKAWGEN